MTRWPRTEVRRFTGRSNALLDDTRIVPLPYVDSAASPLDFDAMHFLNVDVWRSRSTRTVKLPAPPRGPPFRGSWVVAGKDRIGWQNSVTGTGTKIGALIQGPPPVNIWHHHPVNLNWNHKRIDRVSGCSHDEEPGAAAIVCPVRS